MNTVSQIGEWTKVACLDDGTVEVSTQHGSIYFTCGEADDMWGIPPTVPWIQIAPKEKIPRSERRAYKESKKPKYER